MLACPTPYPSPKLIEMIGLIGFDGVWIDMEHQDYDYDQLFAMGLACRASGMDPLVRMRKGPYWSYFRCLEAGANGIMVPHVCSAAEAREVVRNSRFHPLGQRGMDGVEVASDYGMEAMPEYMASANEETLVSIQIEDREGVEAVDEILAVEGLDGIMVGPADLTQSYGVPTQGGHPLIVQAVDRVAEACRRHGKWWGIPVASPEAAEALLRQGSPFLRLRRGHHHSAAGISADLEGVHRDLPFVTVESILDIGPECRRGRVLIQVGMVAALDSPWQKSSRHSTGSASRRTALLLGHIFPICSLGAPCPAGAAPVSMLAGLLPRTVEGNNE